MAIHFSIEHASLVGWLTRRDFPYPVLDMDPMWIHEWRYYHRRHRGILEDTPSERGWRAPRASRRLLEGFLERLSGGVVAHNEEDRAALVKLSALSSERLMHSFRNQEVPALGDALSSREVAYILSPLRAWFDVPFYFLPLGMDLPLNRFAQSPPYTMWLLCDDEQHRGAHHHEDLLDPFPAIRNAVSKVGFDEPVTLCWNWQGTALTIPAARLPVDGIIELMKGPPSLAWDQLTSRHVEHSAAFNILQLSDLHFGAKAVSSRQVAYVEQHIRDKIETTRRAGGVVQPVITGDLMDSPSKGNLTDFEGFRNRLDDMCKARSVCIPGNHDMKRKGFLWRKWETVAGLEWQTVMESDVGKFVFVSFNTSIDAAFARGKITDDQFLDVTTKLEALKRLKDFSQHMFVTLVHHHPFSLEEDELDTIPYLGWKEEPLLRMENGQRLVEWCASKNVPLILHGHKHRPRFVGREVPMDGRTRLVRAVGCGSSFGIEAKPLSYNWITWQPRNKSWTISHFADPGDGTGFTERRLVFGSGGMGG